MTRSRAPLLAVLLVTAMTATACAAGPNNVAHVNAQQIAGFWLGLWHGLICPITFVISLFTDDVSVYEVHNNGNWYDAGFVLGVSVSFGGASRGSGARRRRSS